MLSTVHGDRFELAVVYYQPTEGGDPDDPPEPDLDHPVDLTGYTGLLQVRDRPGGPLALDLSTDSGGGLTLDGPAGYVGVLATPDQMYAVAPGQWRIELQVELRDGSTLLDRKTLLSDVLNVEAQIAVATP